MVTIVRSRLAKHRVARLAAVAVVGAGLAGVGVFAADAPSGQNTGQAAGQTAGQKVDPRKNRVYPQWEIHDMKRPVPPVITPPEPSTQEKPGTPPSDAVVLFDGKDLSHWTAGRGQPAPWKLEDGAMVADKAGIQTREPIGDCQLHVEWATPTEVKGESQERGNSGVLLMGGRYEIQVLDSYDNRTYADGQAGAVYGQNPPMVNPARPPGQWQTYDILWRGPRWDKDGKLLRPARVTILYNGVFVQDDYHLSGPTGHHVQPAYTPHAEKLPLQLQFHGNPTRFRNIWYRPLPPEGVASMAEVEGGADKAGEK